MSDNAYVDLWQFAREIAPEETAKVEAYRLADTISETGVLIPLDDVREATAQVFAELKEYDPLLEEHSPEDVKLLVNCQINLTRRKLKNESELLLEREIPNLIRARLASGDYEIRARRFADQIDVELTQRELVALDINIPRMLLIGSAGSYGEIAIRRRTAAALANAPATADAAAPPRRSHRPTRDRARDAMAQDIAEGHETLKSLEEMTEQYRADKYGVSRETARLASAELVARQTATSTD